MALGNTYQNNKNQMWEASYYSRLRIKNPKDNLALGFTFWKGTLKVSISSLSKDYHTNDTNSDLSYIHLSPTKARLLANLVQTVIEQKSDNIFGVDTGIGEVHGFIAVGREQGNPFLLIAKVNPDGTFESSHKFSISEKFILEDLDSYSVIVHGVIGLVYHCHSADADKLLYFIPTIKSFSGVFVHLLQTPFRPLSRQ